MGSKKPDPVQQVQAPTPEQISASQIAASRGILDLQLEKFPEFTQAEITRLRTIAPEAAEAVVDAQNVVLENVKSQFPQFFDVLNGLGGEALNRLSQIGQLPADVASQAIELSRADQAQRGIVDSPLAVAGTAGQLSLLGQQQRAQDLGLASGFLQLPFAPNLPLTGVSQAGSVSTPQSFAGLQPVNALGAHQLQADIGFSNAALQRSNALLGGGGFSGSGAIAGGATGGLGGALTGAAIGSIVPGIGTGIGALVGGGIGLLGGAAGGGGGF